VRTADGVIGWIIPGAAGACLASPDGSASCIPASILTQEGIVSYYTSPNGDVWWYGMVPNTNTSLRFPAAGNGVVDVPVVSGALRRMLPSLVSASVVLGEPWRLGRRRLRRTRAGWSPPTTETLLVLVAAPGVARSPFGYGGHAPWSQARGSDVIGPGAASTGVCEPLYCLSLSPACQLRSRTEGERVSHGAGLLERTT
jgi:hypothetical protein